MGLAFSTPSRSRKRVAGTRRCATLRLVTTEQERLDALAPQVPDEDVALLDASRLVGVHAHGVVDLGRQLAAASPRQADRPQALPPGLRHASENVGRVAAGRESYHGVAISPVRLHLPRE